MNAEEREFWEWALHHMRREETPTAMSPDQIDALLEELDDEPLPQSQIEGIVESIQEDNVSFQHVDPDISFFDALDTSDVEEQVYQLYRNEGQEDEETLRRIDEHRRKALEDDEQDHE